MPHLSGHSLKVHGRQLALFKSPVFELIMDKDRLIKLQNGLARPCIIPIAVKISNPSSVSGVSPLGVLKLIDQGGERSFLLESTSKIPSIGGGTYSFVGHDPAALITGDVVSNSIEIEIFDESIKQMLIKSIQDVGDLSVREKLTLKVKKGLDIFDALRKCVKFADFVDSNSLIRTIYKKQLFTGGAIGYVSYDAVKELQIRVPTNNVRGHGFEFYIVKDVLVFDHSDDSIYAVINVILDDASDVEQLIRDANIRIYQLQHYVQQSSSIGDSQKSDKPPLFFKRDLKASMTKEEFELATTRGIEHILAGDIFQVLPSIRHEVEIRCDHQHGVINEPTPHEMMFFERMLYEELRRLNPSPYMYFLRFCDVSIIGSSPETLFSVCGDKLITNPIAGTCPRGSDEMEDVSFANSMLNDPKERAEHLMLVDLGRNDVRSVCEGGSVEVIDTMSVVKYSHVQHIESTVAGVLREGYDTFSAARAVMPMGTVSGAPKIRAMELIDKYEPMPRGIYSGGVGYFAFNGDSDFAIAIRTFVIEGTKVSYQAGAGIVADSVPQREYEEVKRKLAALEAALYNVTTSAKRIKMTVNVQRNSQQNHLKILFIDNFDSFVWNLVDYISTFGHVTKVVKNDVSLSDVRSFDPDVIVISPGPGSPENPDDIGSCLEIIRQFEGTPILGICLGHQAIGVAYGAKIKRVKPIHGKPDRIFHDGSAIYKGLPNPFIAGRYHSLVLEDLPLELKATSSTEEGIIMGTKHTDFPTYGLQFHPESVLTPSGKSIIGNFLNVAQTKVRGR